jgi:ketoreductase RED1
MTTDTSPARAALDRVTDVAVVGVGSIGLSWVAVFLAAGLTVRATDTRSRLTAYVEDGLRGLEPSCRALGLNMARGRLQIETRLSDAVGGVQVVQENGPEDLQVKRDLHGRIAERVQPQTLRLTSSSGLRIDALADGLPHPGHLLGGHPFYPPHIVPLVEVVTGSRSDPSAVEQAIAFYRGVGKVPVVLPSTESGVSPVNRLQGAMLREAIRLVVEDGISVADIDRAVVASFGPRLAAGGPFLSFHLNGGAGGIREWFAKIGTRVAEPDTAARVSDEVEATYGLDHMPDLVRARDDRQIAVLAALSGTVERHDCD